MKQCLLGFARRVLRESAGLTSCAWSALSHGLRPMFSHSQVIACKQSIPVRSFTPGSLLREYFTTLWGRLLILFIAWGLWGEFCLGASA